MITGAISAQDYLNAQRLHRSKAVRWYYVASAITVALGVASYVYTNRKLEFIIGCTGVGGFVGELVMSYAYLPWKVRRIHGQQKDLGSPFTYQWDANFLEAQGVSGHSKRPWENYSKFKENQNVFLLYHCDNLFEMFPKSWFQAPEQLEEFRRLATRATET